MTVILIEILIALFLIFAIRSWIVEAIQKRKELKTLKKDIDLLQSMKSEIEEND